MNAFAGNEVRPSDQTAVDTNLFDRDGATRDWSRESVGSAGACGQEQGRAASCGSATLGMPAPAWKIDSRPTCLLRMHSRSVDANFVDMARTMSTVRKGA